MEASVQYNDFVGTAAADMSGDIFLTTYLEGRGVDTKRYNPIGASFYHGENGFFYASIICIDNEDKNEAVKIELGEEVSMEKFFSLFKRFEVIISQNHDEYECMPLKDTPIYIDDIAKNE